MRTVIDTLGRFLFGYWSILVFFLFTVQLCRFTGPITMSFVAVVFWLGSCLHAERYREYMESRSQNE